MQHISLTINVASALVAAATTPNVAVAVAATCIYFLVDSVTPLPEQLRHARSTTNTQTDGLTN